MTRLVRGLAMTPCTDDTLYKPLREAALSTRFHNCYTNEYPKKSFLRTQIHSRSKDETLRYVPQA